MDSEDWLYVAGIALISAGAGWWFHFGAGLVSAGLLLAFPAVLSMLRGRPGPPKG